MIIKNRLIEISFLRAQIRKVRIVSMPNSHHTSHIKLVKAKITKIAEQSNFKIVKTEVFILNVSRLSVVFILTFRSHFFRASEETM